MSIDFKVQNLWIVFGALPYLALDGVGGRLVAVVLAVRAVVLVQQLVELLLVPGLVSLATVALARAAARWLRGIIRS